MCKKNSNLIAAKTHSANEILFINLIKSSELYKDKDDADILNNFKEFINATRAIRYY